MPGEVLPASPAQALLPLHEFVNVLVRKLERQAANQKTLALYQRGESDDADAIKKAADGEMVGVSHPDTVQERKFRGPDPGNHNMAIWGDQMFDVHAGNLGALGGTEAQTETFRGDAMLRESANALVEQMRKAVRTMMKRVIRKHAWFIWTDPIRSYETVKDLGAGIRIRTIMDPDVREGDFIDYNFDIDTYSTRDRTPMERAQSLKQEWAEVVLPNMPFFQAAGMMPNAVEMVKRVFELQGLEFAELFVPTDPNAMAQQQQGGQNGAVPWPGQFNMGMRQTVNTRVSRPGHTRAGNDKSLMDANSRLLASNDSK